jgi:hypothetical protein
MYARVTTTLNLDPTMVQWRALALLLLVLVGIDVALPVGRRPTESRYDTHGVNCSLLGDCYNISGAENSDPHLPTGVDLNGLYAKTSQLCFGQPSWQQAAGGPVVYWFGPSGQWDIGPGGILAKDPHVGKQYCAAANFIYSGTGVCPASPDGAGCAGKWMENHGSPDWQLNSRLKIAAVRLKSDEHPMVHRRRELGTCSAGPRRLAAAGTHRWLRAST